MLKLSRRVEYGIMAVQHIARAQGSCVCTAKEISAAQHIPYELVAKVLQSLTRGGIIVSQQGVNGGYALARRADAISIYSIITAIEGNDPALMPCVEGVDECELEQLCNIKNPLMRIQSKISGVFQAMTVAEISF